MGPCVDAGCGTGAGAFAASSLMTCRLGRATETQVNHDKEFDASGLARALPIVKIKQA